MAIELIRATWCDPHMKNEEMIPGRTFSVAVNGGKPQEIELCDVHEKEFLAPLLELLAEDGREAEKGKRKQQRRAASSSPAVEAAAPLGDQAIVKCPIKPCPEKYEGNRANMRRHLEAEHGTTLAAEETKIGKTLDGEKLTHFCDEVVDGETCGLGFVRSQSLGVHKKRSHGVEGPNSKPGKR